MLTRVVICVAVKEGSPLALLRGHGWNKAGLEVSFVGMDDENKRGDLTVL